MRRILVLGAFFGCWGVAGAGSPSKTIANFQLKDAAGKTWALEDVKDAKAVVVFFLGTQCPINNAYLPQLAELHEQYSKNGVVFVAVNSNEHDTAKAIKEHAAKFKVPFPVLRDEGHQVAGQLGAERVPEAFVLDANRVICYQGRIDDQFGIGYQRKEPKRRYLIEALDAVLAGKTVAQAKVAVEGCLITRAPRPKADAKITYAQHVAPILQNRCQECHRPGQIGPMPLLTYDDAASWAGMIQEVVKERRMPPWHADPRYGKFHNDRSLNKEDYDTLLAWIEQGCPKGDDKHLPAPKNFADGWNIGKPDVVITMPKEFTDPAKSPKGGIPYQYFVAPTDFEEDRWIQAAEAKPGNPSVVHHIIVYVMQGKKRVKDLNGDQFGNGMLVAFAPGDLGSVFVPDSAKKVPKGANLVFQMHYTPNGTEQTDRSSIGLVFAKKPPVHEVRSKAIAQQLLMIWAGGDNQKFTKEATFKKDALVWTLMPHMHLRGKSFEYEAIYPDGKREIVLSVPKYDFGWQANYRLEKPLFLPAGTKIHCTAIFDNSAKNPNNPDPTRLVAWGDQTWEEMMIGFVDYTYVDEKK